MTYDMAPLYGVSRTNAFASVWMMVEAVHCTQSLKLVFPENHAEQQRLAGEFAKRSQAGFDCCVGAVDGILIWILQLSASIMLQGVALQCRQIPSEAPASSLNLFKVVLNKS